MFIENIDPVRGGRSFCSLLQLSTLINAQLPPPPI